jgi:hypothetical protein
MRINPLVLAAICLAAGTAAYTLYPAGPGAKSGRETPAPPPSGPVTEPTKRQILEDIVSRWEKTPNIPANRQALCEEAVGRLGAGEELVEFINFLSASGAATQREWLLGPGLRPLFAGPDAKAARDWMLTVGDTSIRNSMCHRAGEGFGALGFKEYLDSLATSHPDCQSPLLAGRCMAIAKAGLEGAIYAFRELKTRNINHYCLGEALAVALANTDYAGAKAALNALPDDLKREAVTGLRGKQGKNVGPYLAAVDEVIHTSEWPQNEKNLCVKLHNLTLYTSEIDTLLAWASLLPERKDTEDLFRVATRPFVTRKPEDAKKWILSLPAGWKRQNALAGYLQAALAARSDVAGAQWARGLISDPGFAASADGWILDYEKRTGKPYPR